MRVVWVFIFQGFFEIFISEISASNSNTMESSGIAAVVLEALKYTYEKLNNDISFQKEQPQSQAQLKEMQPLQNTGAQRLPGAHEDY